MYSTTRFRNEHRYVWEIFSTVGGSSRCFFLSFVSVFPLLHKPRIVNPGLTHRFFVHHSEAFLRTNFDTRSTTSIVS